MHTCPKCRITILHDGNHYRHVKRCGTEQNRMKCLYCDKTFSRKDDMKKHMKKKHLEHSRETFACAKCKKSFHYEENLITHQRTRGKETLRKFNCPHPGCGKLFTHRTMMEHHRDHEHQTGSDFNIKAKDEKMRKKYLKGEVPELPERVTVKSLRSDKEVSAAKGTG